MNDELDEVIEEQGLDREEAAEIIREGQERKNGAGCLIFIILVILRLLGIIYLDWCAIIAISVVVGILFG